MKQKCYQCGEDLVNGFTKDYQHVICGRCFREEVREKNVQAALLQEEQENSNEEPF